MTDAILISAWIDGPLAVALDHAVADARDTRAGFIRRLLAEHLRENEYLPALPTVRRSRRTKRAA